MQSIVLERYNGNILKQHRGWERRARPLCSRYNILKKELIKNELSELKKFTNMTNEIYTDKFLKKSLLLKMKTLKVAKNNSQHNSTNVYIDVSIINMISKKSKQ